MTVRGELDSLFASRGIRREYDDLDLQGFSLDLQGWGDQHPIFESLLLETRPRVVIEVGTWKGASVLNMHAIAREHGLNTAFVCIDTWLGSAEHWVKPEPRPNMRVEGGHPTLYRQFIANVIAKDAVDDIYPIPISSSAGARFLDLLGVAADLIYIDAAHEEPEVALDLVLFWQVLRGGGIMFGDDYLPSWPGVVHAVDAFAKEQDLEIELDRPKWLMRKPAIARVSSRRN